MSAAPGQVNIVSPEEAKHEDEEEEAKSNLGSELSGMSIEIPHEIEDYEDSASFFQEYAREYKHGKFEKKRRLPRQL